MRQSNNRKSRDVTAFLYERLSRDDNLEGESYSIGNQKKLLTKVAKEKGYTNLVHFLDDGISGRHDGPPRFQRHDGAACRRQGCCRVCEGSVPAGPQLH